MDLFSNNFTRKKDSKQKKKFIYSDRQVDIAGHALSSIYKYVNGVGDEVHNEGQRAKNLDFADWNLIHDYLKATCGNSSKNWQQEESGRTALHIVATLHPPKEIVEHILSMWPHASLIQDKYGCTPLHYACQYNASPSVVLLLLRSYRYAAQLHDTMGDMPIHLACSKASVSFEIVKILLEYDPHHASATNHGMDEKTPLEILSDYFRSSHAHHRSMVPESHNQNQWNKLIACLWASHHGTLFSSSSPSSPIFYYGSQQKQGLTFHACLSQQCCSSSTLYRMAKLYLQHSARIEDEYENYPLIYALSDSRDEKILDSISISLLHEFPVAACYPSKKNGQMPLHLAITSGRSYACLHQLILSCPTALRKKDPESGLLPFMMMATKTKYDLNNIYSFLRCDPTVISTLIGNR